MKHGPLTALLFALAAPLAGASLRRGALEQPIMTASAGADGSLSSDGGFAASAQAGGALAKATGYRAAWDDCGGVGASATERMRSIAARIKGWAKPLPFKRNAAQDCDHVDPTGTKPGPGKRVVYPGPEVHAAQDAGLKTAAETLAKYPAAK